MPWLDKIFKFRETDQQPEAVKPFLDHLEDLRWMLMKVVVTVVVGMLLSFAFRVPLVHIVERPMNVVAPDAQLQVLSPTDSLIIIFEVSFWASVIITFPVLLFYIAQFVLPALTIREKKIVLPGIAAAFVLFVIGMLFSYYFVMPQTLRFLFSFSNSLAWKNNWQVREYVSFVTQMTLVFGLGFELPIVVVVLVYLRLLTSGFLRRTRAYAIVILLFVVMLVAPAPDVVTFVSLSVPMCLLYEACIWLGWFVERARLKKELLPPEGS